VEQRTPRTIPGRSNTLNRDFGEAFTFGPDLAVRVLIKVLLAA